MCSLTIRSEVWTTRNVNGFRNNTDSKLRCAICPRHLPAIVNHTVEALPNTACVTELRALFLLLPLAYTRDNILTYLGDSKVRSLSFSISLMLYIQWKLRGIEN